MLPSIEDKIERAAQNFRAWAKHESQTYPDVFTWVQKLKHEGFIRDYKRVPDVEMPDVEGVYDAFSHVLSIRESAFRNAASFAGIRDQPHCRARFTFAHEVAHVWLEHSGIRYRNTSDRFSKKIDVRRHVDERHANRFAGAILIGRNLVDLAVPITATELAKRFVVSEQVASIRLDELQSIRRRELGLLRPLPKSVEETIRRLKEQNKRS